MAERKPTPYQRIMRAAKKYKGVRLSAEEVYELSMDGAIMTSADVNDQEQARPEKCEECGTGLHPFTDPNTGRSGVSCDMCGWSWDDEEKS